MKIEEIIEELGVWAQPLHISLNYLETHPSKEGVMYRLYQSHVEYVLSHIHMFKKRECYEYYNKIYRGIINEKNIPQDRLRGDESPRKTG
jgi:hypothetical protein